MGIINVNENSFYSPSRSLEISEILKKVELHLKQGATFIDIGATSTKPGSQLSLPDSEIITLTPIITEVKKQFPDCIISLDTYHSKVAEHFVNEGVSIINDISGGRFDPHMFETVSRLKVPYILMHIQGKPEDMQNSPQYKDVVSEVMHETASRVKQLFDLGCKDIIIDPGFGFGKTLEHNFQLLSGLGLFQEFKLPVLVGVSRKSIVNKTLNISSEEALNGTTALNMLALMQGASILRVHDTLEAVQTVELFKAFRKASK